MGGRYRDSHVPVLGKTRRTGGQITDLPGSGSRSDCRGRSARPVERAFAFATSVLSGSAYNVTVKASCSSTPTRTIDVQEAALVLPIRV